jgi:hypothetical protein
MSLSYRFAELSIGRSPLLLTLINRVDDVFVNDLLSFDVTRQCRARNGRAMPCVSHKKKPHTLEGVRPGFKAP